MKSVIVPYDENRQELIAKIGGAVHTVGGPPARLTCGTWSTRIDTLAEITAAVNLAVVAEVERRDDWTVEEVEPEPENVQ